MENEYEKQWSEGEEAPVGAVTDAVQKARKAREDEHKGFDDEFTKAYDEVPEATPAPRFSFKDKDAK